MPNDAGTNKKAEIQVIPAFYYQRKKPRSDRSRLFATTDQRSLRRLLRLHHPALLSRRGVAVNQAFAGRAVEHRDGFNFLVSRGRRRLRALDGQTKSGPLRFVAHRRNT